MNDNPNETVTVTLELRLDGESLAGRARNGDGATRDFVGWLGLFAVIDDLVPGIPSAPGRGDAGAD